MRDSFSSHPQARPQFARKVDEVLPELPNREAQVAHYMMLNISDIGFETGASLAKKVGTSEVTVSRLLRRLGYEGMRGLKRELKTELSAQLLPPAANGADGGAAGSPLGPVLEQEIQAVAGVFRQCEGPAWRALIETVAGAERVYVTGFQTVRGIAEDCARRLALARPDVRFVAAHDSMLSEWIGPAGAGQRGDGDCLVLIDVVPYAREAAVLAEACRDSGRGLVVFSDEFCHWARDFTEHVVFARSRSGLFLESTVGLTAALNLLVHEVAGRDPEATGRRLEDWRAMTRRLNLF